MPMPIEEINRNDLKNKYIPQWAAKYGIDPDVDFSFDAHPEKKGSQIQVMWELYDTGRVNSLRGLEAYYERHARAIKTGEAAQSSEHFWFRKV
jgi:hypothetical protein